MSAVADNDRIPLSKSDIRIAIICALGTEGNAVANMFRAWKQDELPFPCPGDMKVGLMGNHVVVQSWLGKKGKCQAAIAAERINNSFPDIKIVLIVGICGATPTLHNEPRRVISLGDVIISKGIVPYDAGKKIEKIWYPTVPFVEPNTSMFGGLLKRLEFREEDREDMKNRARDLLHTELRRQGLQHFADITPELHLGYMASGDQVIKKASRRDKIVTRSEKKPIGFEMEAAGAIEVYEDRTFVIKGVCDHADERKDDTMHLYAGITSAAFMRVFLDEWDPRGRHNFSHHRHPDRASSDTMLAQQHTTAQQNSKQTRSTTHVEQRFLPESPSRTLPDFAVQRLQSYEINDLQHATQPRPAGHTQTSARNLDLERLDTSLTLSDSPTQSLASTPTLSQSSFQDLTLNANEPSFPAENVLSRIRPSAQPIQPHSARSMCRKLTPTQRNSGTDSSPQPIHPAHVDRLPSGKSSALSSVQLEPMEAGHLESQVLAHDIVRSLSTKGQQIAYCHTPSRSGSTASTFIETSHGAPELNPYMSSSTLGSIKRRIQTTEVEITGFDNAGLFTACKDRDIDKVREFLRKGQFDPAKTDERGKGMLHWVIGSTKVDDKVELTKRIAKIVDLLCRAKANPNLQDKHGHAPIHYCARSLNAHAALVLLKHDANINILDNEKCTALNFLVKDRLPNVGLTEWFIDKGARAGLASIIMPRNPNSRQTQAFEAVRRAGRVTS